MKKTFKLDMKQILHILIFINIAGLMNSCLPLIDKHLTDEIYLVAVDELKELSLIHGSSNATSSCIVNNTVIAVGFNDDFVIVKQRPPDKDTLFYYIIDVNEIKRGRELFVSKIDTMKTRTIYKDQKGNDSLGPVSISIYNTVYYPKSPEPLTFEEFSIKRKQLNIPDSLHFTINYEDFQKKNPNSKKEQADSVLVSWDYPPLPTIKK